MFAHHRSPTITPGCAVALAAVAMLALLPGLFPTLHDRDTTPVTRDREADLGSGDADRDREIDGADRDRTAPRLELPGALTARAGQELELRWTAADSVRELEILLSTDGGRTYTECTPPRLDPAAGSVRWCMPRGEAGSLRLRIRYNRGGREIEGSPVRLVRAGSGDDADAPLALPLAGGAATDAPARGGRTTGPTSELWTSVDPVAGVLRQVSAARTRAPSRTPVPRRTCVCVSGPVDRVPAFVPLRI